MSGQSIDPRAAEDLVLGPTEVAFLDLREPGQFIEGHPLFAINLPYSRLEHDVARLVPRCETPLVLIDADDSVVARAAVRLAWMGYANLSMVAGGAPGWQAAGLTLFEGVNVPSKVLGELAEHLWHPETYEAAKVDRLRREGGLAALVDARPPAEHEKMRLPGSACLPNGELAHRIDAMNLDPDKPLAITCAGRTRGLIGAIGLRLAGYEGPVLAVENGTQGWALAGLPLERGARADALPPLDAASRAGSHRRASEMIRRFGLSRPSLETVRAMMQETARTCFVFDLRDPDETPDGPIPGSRFAPGVQLVQASDQFIGVRHARIVLCCDTGLRSAIAAFWLRQLGYEVHVVALEDHDAEGGALDLLPDVAVTPSPPEVRPIEARQVTAKDCLIDLRPSADYLAGHVQRAVWSIRPRLWECLARSTPDARLVLIAIDDWIADLAAADLSDLGAQDVYRVTGGHEALRAAGWKVRSDPDALLRAERIDFPFFTHGRHDGDLEASRRYLSWETGLIARLSPKERAAYDLSGSTGA